MKPFFIQTLPLLLCLVLLAGCSKTEEPYVPTGDGLTWDEDVVIQSTDPVVEHELVLCYYEEASMNPLVSNDYTNRVLFSLIYQGLFATNSDYTVVPILVKHYRVSDDLKYWTFYLEEAATFSDGTPVTLNDVLATYEAADKSSYYGGRFTHLEDIYLTADGGITFEMDTAYENLPLLLDIPILKADEIEAERPLGSGPYYLDTNLSGLHLRKHPNWWCDVELIFNTSAISLVKAENPAQIRDEFQFNDVGLVCADSSSENFADFRSDYELWNCEDGLFLYIGCNTESVVFSNTTVRAALTYAIDREKIVNEYYHGFAHAATLAASPLSPYYSNTLANRYAYEPEKFTSALQSQGLSGQTVVVAVNKNDTLRMRVARAIGAMLEECGLKVTMSELAQEDYLYHLANRNFDIYVGQTKLSPNYDLTQFFRNYGVFRYGGMTDAAVYALCLDALANKGNYYNLHQTIANDGRLTPVLFHSYAIYATRGLLTELEPSRDNVFYYTLGKTMRSAQIYED